MSTLIEIQKKIQKLGSSVIAIGNFDGVHVGHQAIFQQVKKIANEQKLNPLIFILYPHPKEIFSGSSPALLTSLEDRKNLIQKLGFDDVFDLTFDLTLSEIRDKELLQKFKDGFGMKHFVIGPTTHIGKNREGTPERIVELSKIMGFGVSVLNLMDVKGCRVSSSSIREYVSKGDVRLVSNLLGRHYSTHGIVETGAGKGKTIGFPTANIAQIQTMVPARGVYAGYAILNEQRFKAAINIGIRPTITSDKTLVVECHIIDFNNKIVGQNLEVQWVEKLRDEVKFGSVDELKGQIQRDVRKAKDIL